MKAVILAGGLGTRLAEETSIRPKPLVEIGGHPILWHIMKLYSYHGINEFIICCGYKGYLIKEYFANYFMHMSDITFDLQNNKMEIHERRSEPWRVTLINTGENSMTGGRLLMVRDHLKNEKNFCFTYGDGLSDIDISKSLEFHKNHGKLATLTSVAPPSRFGVLKIKDDEVIKFREKPIIKKETINGGFFVLSTDIFTVLQDILKNDTIWESQPLAKLASLKQLMAFNHPGFWQPMDTLRDKELLERLWKSGKAPWKRWE